MIIFIFLKDFIKEKTILSIILKIIIIYLIQYFNGKFIIYIK